MKTPLTVQGRSLILNISFVVLNLIGLTFVVLGFHKNFETQFWLLNTIGFLLMIVSIIGLIIFKGRIMMSNTSRVLVGGLCIVSGLVKANDPLGFSYKFEEYFEDGALAFRIKEWFNAPTFSLEFLIEYALLFSVLICVAEIVLGVLLILGSKLKLVTYLVLLMMLFFTFLTWHTANCDPNKKFIDRDEYAMSDPLAKIKLDEAKTNKEIKIISKKGVVLIVDEKKQPQCVTDCGCFGDALKGSVGRSLSPMESLWKDIILVYLSLWIFLAQWRTQPNSFKGNVRFLVTSLSLVVFFSWVFGWYFPILFALVVLVGALWIEHYGGKYLGNALGSTLFVSVIATFLIVYVLAYEPIKDYRPYAVGSNLRQKMNDGIEGKFESLLVYKNIKTGELKKYSSTSKAYINSKIWEKKEWKYLSMEQKTIVEPKLPSITEQFNPFISVSEIGREEEELSFIQSILKNSTVESVVLKDLTYEGDPFEVPAEEYSEENYPSDSYQLVERKTMADPNLVDISIRDFIVKENYFFLLNAKKLSDANWNQISQLKTIALACKKKNIPFVLITNASRAEINVFRKKYHFNIPIFVNDETELKAISRSNPTLLVIKKGIVIGKYPHRSLPTFDWLTKNILK